METDNDYVKAVNSLFWYKQFEGRCRTSKPFAWLIQATEIYLKTFQQCWNFFEMDETLVWNELLILI